MDVIFSQNRLDFTGFPAKIVEVPFFKKTIAFWG
jgi:hypothetical protein